MTTTSEQRKIRLKNDYREMENLRGAVVQWRAVAGEPPYVEEYELAVTIQTIIGPNREARREHTIRLRLPTNYPTVPPETVMVTRPQPFHPNWYLNGKWCSGSQWDMSEGLGHHVVRMMRTLQFDPEITNPASAANSEARDWYLRNQSRGWFPTGSEVLPDPTHDTRFKVHGPATKAFRVE